MIVDYSGLKPHIARLAQAKVLVVGDLILDRFIHGSAERLSPEAPVPVLSITHEREMLGGAGNVIQNVAALGGAATIVSAIGDDSNGKRVAQLLSELPRVTAELVVDRSRRTSVKTRYLAGSQQLLRTDHETIRAIDAAVEDALLRKILDGLRSCGVLVLSDYGKGVLTKRLVATAIEQARKQTQHVLVIVDPKDSDFGKYAGADLITPNRKELAEAAGLPTRTDSEVENAVRKIAETHRISAVLGTRGPEGMTLLDETGEIHHVPADFREVFDVSGAGDTVVATVAANVSAGVGIVDAVSIANVAAGIVVGKAGTAVAHPDEIIDQLERKDGRLAGGKILERDRAIERVEIWRRRGLTTGFTNGCFDLIHPGHMHLLAQARAACDRLVVGLNSDASVKRLKGNGRPVQGEAARAAVLAGLADVDLVTVFAEDTPEALIAALRPDVLVKGADYTMDTVVGADLVKSYGGRVVLAELLPGHSTTATVAKLK
jgi:D-beta-D-heptose 7-phosphate kinase/D-beta-D-heptose 1-phosphate adenosyltransferase